MKWDEITKAYAIHSKTIYNNIIITDNTNYIGILDSLGIFSIKVSTRNGNIDLVYHLLVTITNILTKKKRNFHTISGLEVFGLPTEKKLINRIDL